VNGVNVDQLFNAIDLFKEKPELALFKFRATNKWLGKSFSYCPDLKLIAELKTFYMKIRSIISAGPMIIAGVGKISLA
jgi:hypothetical protein